MQFTIKSRLAIPVALATVSFLAASCTVLQPKADLTQFYVLRARTVSPTDSRADGTLPDIRVGSGRVAGYLQATRITVEDGRNRVKYLDRYHWAEPLPKAISRVLSEDLAIKLNVTHITVYPEPAPDTNGCEIEYTVNRFEGSLDGPVTLDVSWQILERPSNEVLSKTRSTYSIPVNHQHDTPAYVDRLALAIGRWSDDVAQAIQTHKQP